MAPRAQTSTNIAAACVSSGGGWGVCPCGSAEKRNGGGLRFGTRLFKLGLGDTSVFCCSLRRSPEREPFPDAHFGDATHAGPPELSERRRRGGQMADGRRRHTIVDECDERKNERTNEETRSNERQTTDERGRASPTTTVDDGRRMAND